MKNLTHGQALRQLLIFSVPIIFGQIGLMLIGTGDMIVAGRYSRELLAAVGLAIAIANPIQISFLGMQFSIGPILAQRRGKGEEIRNYFWTVIAYSLGISAISCALTFLSVLIVPWLGYGPRLTAIIQDYLLVVSFSSFGLGLYQGVKEFFQSEEKTMVANVIALLGAGVNLVFNYLFVFGEWGFPQLYEIGLAWASLGTRMVMALALCLTARTLWSTSRKLNRELLREMATVGLPVSFTLFLEIMAFCLVTLFVGKFTAEQIAANNLALNIGSLSFMIPLSISSAVAVKVGHAYGERRFEDIRTHSRVALATSFAFTLLTGSLFYFLPEYVLGLYTQDHAVIVWGARLLLCIAGFQLFDGAQVTISGVLRGLSVTRAPSVSIFIGYWIIGIPLGYFLGFHTHLAAQGFWIGLAVALATVALMLSVIMKRKFRDFTI
jgi:MATE family multidrug resistance protein